MPKQTLADYKLEKQYLATLLMYWDDSLYRPLRLDPSDFASTAHQEILRIIYEVEEKTGSIDEVAVINHIKNKGGKHLEAVHSLYELQTSDEPGFRRLLTPSDVEIIVDRLRKLAECREIQKYLFESQKFFAEGDLELGKDSLRTAYGALQQDRSRYQVENIGASMRYAYDTVIQGNRKRIDIGIPVFDRSIGFLSAGSATVIGGKTSAGKSSLALDIARGMVSKGHRPGIISLEDGPDVWGSRCLARTSGFPISYAKESAFLNGDEQEVVRLSMQHNISNPPDIIMAYGFAPTPEIVFEMVTRLVKDKLCDVVFVDYLQTISIDLRSNRIDKAYANVFSRLKAIGKQLDIPVIVLSQIKRIEGKEPSMFDLKETGDVENGAEVVILIWHDGDNTYVKTDKIKWSSKKKFLRAEVIRDSSSGMITGYEEV